MSKEKSEIITIQGSRFGELQVPASSVIEMVTGLIGFPDVKKYTLLEYNPPFSWLQSVDSPDLAFVVVNAAEFGDAYQFPVPVGDRDLDLKEDDDIAAMNLVSVRSDPTLTTVNLKAPVLVNLRTMRGRQLILDDARYPTRFPLWSQESGDKPKEK